MTDEERCLALLSQTEEELEDTLKTELADVKKEDEELTRVEGRLEKILERLLEIEGTESPDMTEVERLYQEYLVLTNRQSQLTDCLQIGIDTVGICESALY